MRICYLCADRGIPISGEKGAAAHVRGFTRALLALGHEVRLLSPVPGEASADLPVRVIATPDIVAAAAAVLPPRMGRALGHLWTNVAVEQALQEVVATFRPHLIYERYSPFSAAGTLLSQTTGVPHVLEVNSPLAWEGDRYRRQALGEAAAALEHAVFTTATLVVAVSEELKEWLVRAGVAAERILVVPNGVDTAMFTPHGARRRDAPADRVVIGFVGTLKPWHGLDVLAQSFRELATDERYHLLVVGDGPERTLLEGVAAEWPGRVTLTGAVPHDRIAEYLRGMDIAVAPYPASSDFYFSPLKVLEYMAVGLPVIASGIGQVRAQLRPGETGLLVEPGDAGALVAAIRELADAPEQRTRLGRSAAAEVAAAHGWESRAAHVLNAVGELEPASGRTDRAAAAGAATAATAGAP